MTSRWLARWLGVMGWAQFVAIVIVTIVEKIHETLRLWLSNLYDWLRYRARWKVQEYVQARVRRVSGTNRSL
jgi:hypothetical protein